MGTKSGPPIPKLPKDSFNFAVVDIETCGLDSHKFVQMVGIKPIPDGEPYLIDFTNTPRNSELMRLDANIVVETKRHLEAYDGWVTWNGRYFDKPFLNDRLAMSGSRILENRFHVDLMRDCFKWPLARTKGISLKWVAAQFACPFGKVDMDIMEHTKAEYESLIFNATGKWSYNREKYDKLRDHCIEDLRLTQWMISIGKARVTNISKNRVK